MKVFLAIGPRGDEKYFLLPALIKSCKRPYCSTQALLTSISNKTNQA